jgi:hypothetical protein
MRTGSLRHHRLLALLAGAVVLATLVCTDATLRPTATPRPSASPPAPAPTSTVDPNAIVLRNE